MAGCLRICNTGMCSSTRTGSDGTNYDYQL